MAEFKTMTKAELAEKCKVSSQTVQKWCNVDYYQELIKLGYKKNQHIFTPRQTVFLQQNIMEYAGND